MIKWLLHALVLMGCAYLIPGIHVDGFLTALLAVLVIGVINIFIRPIFIVLTIPLTILTLGLFLLVVNGCLFYFAGHILSGFRVDGALPALLGSLAYSLVSTLLTSRD